MKNWWKHRDAWERYDYLNQAGSIRRLAERSRDLVGQPVVNPLVLRIMLTPVGATRAPRSLVDACPQPANA